MARPGGHITGFVDTSPDLSGKRLEILSEVWPKGTHIVVIWNGDNPIKALDFEETASAAQVLGLNLVSVKLKHTKGISEQLSALIERSPSALLVLQDAFTLQNAKTIVEFASTNHMPAMYGSSEFVEAGGLMAYAANYSALFRGAAVYVDKILKGSKVGNLPIEQPMTFEFVVNLKTARALGLMIPTEVMVRATRVIE